MFNYSFYKDTEIIDMMKQINLAEVKWHESSVMDNSILSPITRFALETTQALISERYLKNKYSSVTELSARIWCGQTLDGDNRDWHNDSLWEIRDESNRLKESEIVNYTAFYHFTDYSLYKEGGLSFWNTTLDPDKTKIQHIYPKFEHIMLLDESNQDEIIMHKVHSSSIPRYVASWRYRVSKD